MAGSYKHCVAEDGQLLTPEQFSGMIENLGDAYEAIEEMYGMVWYLAEGDASRVEAARQRHTTGLGLSPGIEGRLPSEED
jgi:hypothetical protein